jgi:hypothetical protein
VSAHVQDRLSAYLDGELVADEREAVEAHLDGCPACERHLEELRAVDAAARDLTVEAPPGYFDSFPARVRSRLPAARSRRPATWIWAAAAVFALAALTPLVVTRSTAPAPDAAVPRPAEEAKAAPDRTPATTVPPAEAPLPEAAAARSKIVAAAPKAEAPGQAPPPPPLPAPAPAAVGGVERLHQRDEGLAAAQAPPPYPVQKRAGPYAQGQAAASTAEAAPVPAAPAAAARDQMADRPLAADKEQAEPRERDAQEGRRDTGSENAAGFAETSKDAARYRQLLGRRAALPPEARLLHDQWRAFAESSPAGPHADEARVRAIEAMALAFHLGGDARDRDRARAEAEAYLARPDAPQVARVRAVLSHLD